MATHPVNSYVIGEPVDAVPPPVQSNKRDDWRYAYRAAEAANGRWVPVTMPDPNRARNLAAVSKKRKGMQAEARGRVCYLRVPR